MYTLQPDGFIFMESYSTLYNTVSADAGIYPRARIFKLLRTPGIDSTESIPCEDQFRRGGGKGRTRVDSSFPVFKI